MKVLVYMKENDLAPIGGPRGYNYNLFQTLREINEKRIEFIVTNNESVNNKVNYFVEKIKNKNIKELLTVFKSIANRLLILYGKSKKPIASIAEYDVIHFHNPLEMYEIRKSLDNYKGKVILTSHSPTISSVELIDTATDFEKKYIKKLYQNLEKIDMYAFARADYVIFPCEEAEEPYYNSWNFYEKFKRENAHKYKYLLTGINQCNAKKNRQEILRENKIPEDAFVVSYVGRHNSIKGYDNLLRIGEELLKLHKDVYILVAGKEGPIYRLNNARWIEIGWTRDPHSIIGASDIFILPNRQTYFDLILLEVLSLGKIIVASNTGGNKYFKKYPNIGTFLYNTVDDAIELVNSIIDMPRIQRENFEKSNLNIYTHGFTCEIFTNNYIHILEEILYNG